jgi:carboxypeptidase family protein
MVELSPNSAFSIFDEFLVYLRQQGFIIGVDHYLRLQELLNKINGQCKPNELSTLLCPIFATSKSQQEKFYRAFDAYFALLGPAPVALADGEDNQPPPVPEGERASKLSRKAILAAIVIFALATAFALALILIKPLSVDNSNRIQQANINANANSQNNDNRNAAGIGDPNNRNLNSNQRAGANKNASPIANRNSSVEQSANKGRELPPPSEPAYLSAIRASAILAPLAMFLIYEWYLYKRRKLTLQKQYGHKPPFVFTLRIESPASRIFNSEQFYTASRRMRRRQLDKYYRLDVDATIAATTKSLGFPSFRYKADSKFPEYLVLIDRASFRDHQAQLFDNLARALKQEGLYVASYFYEGDPRICCNEKGEYFQLADLQNRHADYRLLIFGNCERMVNPLTGELELWTSIFFNWLDRAALTPEPAARWGLRESVLAEQFALAPASLSGLLAMVDYFESGTAGRLRPLLRSERAAPPRDLDQEAAIEGLRGYLGERIFQWLCACAVYPELQWGLTLYLGSLSCMGKDLIKEENLLRLASLSWFRNGAIPDAARLSLIRELDKEKEKAIREAIIELLEHVPAAKKAAGAVAADAYELNLAVERWFFHLDETGRRKLRRVVVKLPPREVFRDYTLVRFLESAPNTRLAMMLPRRLRAIFYSNAMPEFGLRTSARFAMTLILMAAIWGAMSWLIKPPISEAKIVQFFATAKTITSGETVVLWYGVTNASGARLEPEPGDLEILEENIVDVAPERTTAYKLTAVDSRGRTTSQELTVEVVPDTALRIASFNADVVTATQGQPVNLCYDVRNASGVRLDYSGQQVPIDFNALAPSYNGCFIDAPNKTTTYTLTAYGADNQSVTQEVTVEVASPNDARIVSFTATPSTINEGDSTKLCYEATNASSAAISSNFGDIIPTRNNCATVAPTRTTIYTLKAMGQTGEQTQSLTVTVAPRGKIIIKEFSANPALIDSGNQIQLCYEVANADRVKLISPGTRMSVFGERENPRDRVCVTVAPSTSRTYTLLASKANGESATQTITVGVREPDAVKISNLAVKPAEGVSQNEATLLCFRVAPVSSVKEVKVAPPPGPRDEHFGFDRAFGETYCYQIAPKGTTAYTIYVTDNAGRTITDQITAQVQQPVKRPRITFFTASPQRVLAGGNIQLCYGVENAEAAILQVMQNKTTIGTISTLISDKNCITEKPTETTTYILIARANGVDDTQQITVSVDPAPTAPAQETWGALRGTVVDAEGKGAPNVKVVLTMQDKTRLSMLIEPYGAAHFTGYDRASGKPITVTTDDLGQFVASPVPIGIYNITISTKGHLSARITGVEVKAGDNNPPLKITLK